MHVAITGASSGLGAALARELSEHALTLVARRRDLLEALATSLPRARAVAHDLADPSRAAAWIADAEAAHGPIDVLINNAGMENTGPSWDADPEVCRKVFDLNLITPVLLTRHVLPAMGARGRGTIVNVASVAALCPVPMQTYYGASKAGLAAFSESLGGELAGSGVRVLTVYPGPLATAMGASAAAGFGPRNVPRGVPEGSPEELARLIGRALARKTRRIIYPRVYQVTRWFPNLSRWSVDSFGPKPG